MLLLFFTIIGLDASCQIDSNYHYKIVYEMILSYNNPTLYEANFYYNQTKSLFEYEEKSNEDFMDYSVGDSVVHEHLRTNKIFKHKINIDKTENVLTELVEGFIKKELYEIKEPIPIINWNIRDEVKKINKYDCTEATCNFRGRNYSVWFTTDPKIGDVAAAGSGGIVKRSIDENKLKLGGHDEEDKYNSDQLISQGYHGLKFPADEGHFHYQIFHPEMLNK